MSFLKTLWLWLEQFAQTLAAFVVETLFLLIRCPAMFPVHVRLWEKSLQTSPYLLSQQAQMQTRSTSNRSDEWTYGEVLLPSIWKGLSWISWTEDDRLLDLGSGRGRVVFLGAAMGLRAHGVELLLPLVERGQQIARELEPRASFEHEDLLKADWSEGTIFWLTGTCLHSETRQAILEKLLNLGRPFWLLSVTRPLASPLLPLLREEPIWTTWGRDRLYLQRFVPSDNRDNLSEEK
jgi:hypothetical protein